MEDRRAALQPVLGGTPSRVAISCQLAKAQSAQLSCKEEEQLSTEILWERIVTGVCLKPQGFLLGRAGRGNSAVCVPSAAGGLHVPCIAVTAGCVRDSCTVLYLSCILSCCAFCPVLLLSFPDVWTFILSSLLFRQCWHRAVTAWLGLRGKLPTADKGEEHLSRDFDIKL